MHGLPGLRYLNTRDPDERLLFAALARSAWQIRDLMHQNLAIHIVNELGKAMRRG